MKNNMTSVRDTGFILETKVNTLSVRNQGLVNTKGHLYISPYYADITVYVKYAKIITFTFKPY